MAIDSKLLMIGDWVKYTNPPYIQVANITKKKIGYHIKPNEPRMHYVRTCEVEPIPLTPEILEKNGFVLKSDGWLWCAIKSIEDKNYSFIQYRKGCQEVRLCEINFTNNVIMRSQFIQYVHELQHALKLCKIENSFEL